MEWMQIKTKNTISYSDWQKTEESDNVKRCEECETEFSYTAGGNMSKYHPGELIGNIQ